MYVIVMDEKWGSGDPRSHLKLPSYDNLAYDDHNYAQWMVYGSNATREGYLEYLCTNTRSSEFPPTLRFPSIYGLKLMSLCTLLADMDDSPVITGEFSISTMGGGELDPASEGAQGFFQDFASAAIVSAEKGA